MLDTDFNCDEKLLIILHGKARSGKDTFGSLFKMAASTAPFGGLYSLSNIDVETMALADPIKKVASVLLDMTLEEIEENKEKVIPKLGFSPRKFLQLFGTELMRKHFGEDIWTKLMIERIDKSESPVVIVTDARMSNEIQMLRNLKYFEGVKVKETAVIKIVMGNSEQSLQGEYAQHFSEQYVLPDEEADFVVHNEILEGTFIGSMVHYLTKVEKIKNLLLRSEQ